MKDEIDGLGEVVATLIGDDADGVLLVVERINGQEAIFPSDFRINSQNSGLAQSPGPCATRISKTSETVVPSPSIAVDFIFTKLIEHFCTYLFSTILKSTTQRTLEIQPRCLRQ